MDAKPIDWRRASSTNWALSNWPLVLGLLVLAVPALIDIAQQSWSTEAGAHGPLVLATGGWLIWRQREEYIALAMRGSLITTLLILLPSLIIYCFGRAFDYLFLEAAGLYGAGAAAFYDRVGGRALRRLWFPLLYMALAIPLPIWVLDFATAPLKTFASYATTHFMQFLGVPVVREGVILFVAQYQLLVEDACAGLNSLVGLTALGLFYAYLAHGTSWRYAMVLTLLIVPIAVAANIIRIAILIMITLWAGNDAAQSYLHGAAGLIMFATALLLIFAVDSTLLNRLMRERNHD